MSGLLHHAQLSAGYWQHSRLSASRVLQTHRCQLLWQSRFPSQCQTQDSPPGELIHTGSKVILKLRKFSTLAWTFGSLVRANNVTYIMCDIYLNVYITWLNIFHFCWPLLAGTFSGLHKRVPAPRSQVSGRTKFRKNSWPSFTRLCFRWQQEQQLLPLGN